MDDFAVKMILTSILNTQKILLAAEANRMGLFDEKEYKKFLADVIHSVPDSKDLFRVD